MHPTRRAVLAATVSSIALAGCAGDGTGSPEPEDGGGADGDSGTPTATQSPSPDPTPSPTSSSTADPTPSPTPSPTADPTPTPTAMTATATVQVQSHPDLGDILVDAEGLTLYMFDSDTQGAGASTCSGDCANAWPPLTTEGEPATGSDVTAELTTFERADGSTQVAADGWPLYYFASDEQPGDANGQGANDVWWVLRPDGTPVRQSTPTATPTGTATPTPTDTPDGGGGGY